MLNAFDENEPGYPEQFMKQLHIFGLYKAYESAMQQATRGEAQGKSAVNDTPLGVYEGKQDCRCCGLEFLKRTDCLNA
jgi:hypothetical protein